MRRVYYGYGTLVRQQSGMEVCAAHVWMPRTVQAGTSRRAAVPGLPALRALIRQGALDADSARKAAASARAPSESETGTCPASEPAAALVRIPRVGRASKLAPRTPRTAQLAADPAHPFSTLDVCGDGTHTHTHTHTHGIRGECETCDTPSRAHSALDADGAHRMRRRTRVRERECRVPALGTGCCPDVHTQRTPLHACDRARLSRRRRTGDEKATGKRVCAHIQAPQPKNEWDGDGMGIEVWGCVGQIEKEGAHLGMRLELVASGIAGGGGDAELTHLALPTHGSQSGSQRGVSGGHVSSGFYAGEGVSEVEALGGGGGGGSGARTSADPMGTQSAHALVMTLTAQDSVVRCVGTRRAPSPHAGTQRARHPRAPIHPRRVRVRANGTWHVLDSAGGGAGGSAAVYTRARAGTKKERM
ncbi:hypothetical protein C8F04DRAFT_1258085 [Mycena alexandri]|uniref:Uncharacterized protein n=1 Tax=Mycena alexandri TaxID=1745969 RepID=A0AAD6SYN4_9AGAR|nr:hypothetical protein C8F04DRAFT_1258085 [Mycena alexandri]